MEVLRRGSRGERTLLLLFLSGIAFVLQSRPLLAQQPPVGAVKTTRPPTIDAVIVEEEWRGAARLEGFAQLEPARGAPASQKTTVLFMYDSENVYFAVRCFDSEPGKITARLNRRDDSLNQDDSVTILLDTFHDRRTAYYFATNPLGTQLDGRIKDDGRTNESSWDATWSSAGRLDGEGWSAEFAIPLRAIMFKTGSGLTWGFNVIRSRRANLETSYWYGPLEGSYRISQYGEISGLELEQGGAKRWELIPYVQGRWEQGRSLTGQAGLDFRYTLRPETTANITVNPDFAIIEADQEFVNLTRYEPRLEEKRPFFLETNNRFRQRIQTFYSRRIADIDFGGQLVSRRGPWDFTFLSVQSPDVAIPNAAQGDPASASANFTVGRAELNFLRSSNVAFMVSNRYLDGANQGSVGIDTTMHWSRKVNFTGQLVRSYGPAKEGVWAFYARPSYDTNTGHFHVRFTHMGKNFADNANATGFVQDDNRREIDSDATKTFWFQKGAIQRLQLGLLNNIFWSQENVLRGYHNVGAAQVDFRNRWFAAVEYRNEFRLYEKGFHNDRGSIEVGYNTREFNSWSIEYQQGKNFDADLKSLGARFQRKLTRQLSFDYQLSRVWLDPDPSNQTTVINVFRVQQNFTRDLYVRAFFQTNSVIDRRNLEIVCVWRHKPPFGLLQFAFQRGRAAFGERSDQGNTFFVKASHVF